MSFTLRLNADLKRILAALTLSSLLTSAAAFVIPVAYLSLFEDPLGAAAIGTAEAGAALAGSAVAGLLVDRLGFLRIVKTALVVESVAFAVLGVVVASRVAAAYAWSAAAFVVEVAGVTVIVGESAALRFLASDTELADAVRARQIRMYLTTLLGPPLGALLLGLHAWLPFVVVIATNALAWGVVATLPRTAQQTGEDPAATTADDGATQGSPAETDVGGAPATGIEGGSYRDGAIRSFLLFIFLICSGSSVILPILVYRWTLHGVEPASTSLLAVAVGAGGICGSTLVAPWVDARLSLSPRRLVTGACVILAVLSGALVAAHDIPLALVLVFVISAVSPILTIALIPPMMRYVDDGFQGRFAAGANLASTIPSLMAPMLAALDAMAPGHVVTAVAPIAFVLASVVLILSSGLRRVLG